MNRSPQEIILEIQKINQRVTTELRKKGYVPARKISDGSTKIGNFIIKKHDNGTYFIIDITGEIIVENINLPHTAAVVANRLALGFYSDKSILDVDRRYGHYSFDEQLYRANFNRTFKDKQYDRAEILIEKFRIAKLKKEYCRQKIVDGFNKLVKTA